MSDKVARKRITRKKTITIIIILIIIGLGTIAYFGVTSGFIAQLMKARDTSPAISKTGAESEYKEAFNQAQDKVYSLIEAGSNESLQEATKIIDSEVAAAEKSGNDGYKVDANLAKTTLLIKTGQVQEALDTVLLPLDQLYGNNDTYKYEIYASIGWAYSELGDVVKADEYFNKIPGKGWDE